MSVKDRLKELRQTARLSQADVHEMTGISQSQISKFEKGMVLPSIDAVMLLAKALKVSPLEIVRDDFCLTDEEIASHSASSEVNVKHQQAIVPKKEIEETNQLMQMGVGLAIKRLREKKGLSVNALAKLAKVPQSSLRLYELGEREVPLSAIKPLAKELNVHPFELITEELGITNEDAAIEVASLVSLEKEIDETNQLMQAALKLNMAIKELGHKLTSKEIETLDSMLGLCRETLLQEAQKTSESAPAKTA